MKLRKEVHLTKEQIEKLQAQADEDGRSLKNYMERLILKSINI